MGKKLNISTPTNTLITELIHARDNITVKNQTKKQVIGTVILFQPLAFKFIN